MNPYEVNNRKPTDIKAYKGNNPHGKFRIKTPTMKIWV